MHYGHDTRLVCGTDVRRFGYGPEDAARAEGFVARYGGLLSVAPVGGAAVSVTWETGTGQAVSGTGLTFADALRDLQRRVAS